MSKIEVSAFWGGVFVGLMFTSLVLILAGATPKHQLQKDRQEAVDHGYAKWTATTNGVVEFKWKE